MGELLIIEEVAGQWRQPGLGAFSRTASRPSRRPPVAAEDRGQAGRQVRVIVFDGILEQ